MHVFTVVFVLTKAIHCFTWFVRVFDAIFITAQRLERIICMAHDHCAAVSMSPSYDSDLWRPRHISNVVHCAINIHRVKLQLPIAVNCRTAVIEISSTCIGTVHKVCNVQEAGVREFAKVSLWQWKGVCDSVTLHGVLWCALKCRHC
jgi:hypothetical protein